MFLCLLRPLKLTTFERNGGKKVCDMSFFDEKSSYSPYNHALIH